ncbi:DUF29 domain-containing protein [Thiocapsa marina]|uniref:DUF29 domain-containing protein n=1 Tax=Thiocapsa marina 5811 TaxID=768671 RepID=F9UEJ7_9GAMM|nr:DUF29 domain-containing protein [Thiocapsa marina]EGV17318.1 protein of unknown function DUF29 [Thiocapsa marina 5811]
MTPDADYDRDFYAWIARNVALLRAGRVAEVDAEHIAEELESMGKRDLRQLRSRLQVLTMHLLKWQFQPDLRSKSWLATIDHQRDEIESLLLDSPSLRSSLDDALTMIYPKAVRDASRESGLHETAFPNTCPYTLEEILSPGFLPESGPS